MLLSMIMQLVLMLSNNEVEVDELIWKFLWYEVDEVEALVLTDEVDELDD